MREIKFRAKRIDDGRWVYGQYFKTPLTDENSGTSPDVGWFFLSGEERHCIVQEHVSFVIDVNTLGQYTGLKVVNGNEIYEGDIIKHPWSEDSYEVISYIDGSEQENLGMEIGFYIQRDNFESFCMLEVGEHEFEVVGNIHDNQELLK